MGRKNGLIIVAQNFFTIFYVKIFKITNANKFKPTNAERKNGLIIVALNFFIIFYVKNLRKFNANKFKAENTERKNGLIIVAQNFFIIFYVNTNISEPRLRSFLLFFMSKNLRKSDANIFSVNNVERTIEDQKVDNRSPELLSFSMLTQIFLNHDCEAFYYSLCQKI